MPRPRKPDGREPKSRSRNGCWSCKARKVKCTEERPSCAKCIKGGYQCDYGIRLNWDGRRSKRPQLKAVHLDSVMNADETESDTHDGTGMITLQSRSDPSQPESAASPQSTSSSSITSPTKALGEQVTFMPIQMPGQPNPTGKPSRPAKTGANSATAADSDSPFRILAPMVSTTSPNSFHFEVRTSATNSRRGTAPATTGASTASAPTASKGTKAADGSGRTSRTGSMSMPKAPAAASGRSDEGSYLSDTASNSGQRSNNKRPRMDSDVSERDFAWTWPMSPSTGSNSLSAASPRQGVSSSRTSGGDGSSPSEDGQPLVSPHSASSFLYMNASDFRRLSVNSLLSGSQDLSNHGTSPPISSTAAMPIIPQAADSADGIRPSHQQRRPSGSHHHQQNHHRSSIYYGIDGGFPDLDLGKNDDANALSGVGRGSGAGKKENGVSRGHGGYYDKPMAVRIPRALGPLPSKLTENPMNMLYFHHFINHTARVLVPHDDPRSNPFRTILPQMALKNDNLLSLLLAYSASHRARVLDQTEPGMRIALWVQDIFPALRSALDDHKQKISNANVATAIMLASLAIVSPTAFGYNIPWQKHLMLARQIIAARPEGLRVDHHSSVEGQVCSFLWSWFAYLDVLGGLSGGPTDASPAWILDYKVYDPQDDDEIDCIMGFTTRCVYILSQIAELVRMCEPERLRITKKDPDGWIPSMEVEMRVDSLDVDVRDSMQQVPRACSHLHRSGDVVRWDRKEMSATNEAYHWAALVHLHRRVLGKPGDHPDVAVPVQRIIDCLDRVRVGGTAENCLLFPLFTAGCECTDSAQRKKLLKRMFSVEGIGMMQVTRARSLMQKTWGMGKPWETILTTEFIG